MSDKNIFLLLHEEGRKREEEGRTLVVHGGGGGSSGQEAQEHGFKGKWQCERNSAEEKMVFVMWCVLLFFFLCSLCVWKRALDEHVCRRVGERTKEGRKDNDGWKMMSSRCTTNTKHKTQRTFFLFFLVLRFVRRLQSACFLLLVSLLSLWTCRSSSLFFFFFVVFLLFALCSFVVLRVLVGCCCVARADAGEGR